VELKNLESPLVGVQLGEFMSPTACLDLLRARFTLHRIKSLIQDNFISVSCICYKAVHRGVVFWLHSYLTETCMFRIQKQLLQAVTIRAMTDE
jgi:hypothetical protein